MKINTRHVKAASLAASREPGRQNIKGVNIEGKIVVATTGQVVVAIYNDLQNESEWGGIPPFTIPIDAARRIGRLRSEYVTVNIIGPGWMEAGGIAFRAIEGEFVNWRTVIPAPSEAKKAATHLDPSLSVVFCKIGLLLGTKRAPQFYSNGGESVARVYMPDINHLFVGAIMPFRTVPLAWGSAPDIDINTGK